MTGVGVLAHGLHYAMLLVGFCGVAFLLAPVRSRRPDGHDDRVRALRAEAVAGTLGTPSGLTATVMPAPERVVRTSAVALPVALVGSACAAGVHAAVVPAHLDALPAYAVFFLAVSLAQLAWTGRALLRPSRELLLAGVVGNGALLMLWLGSRVTASEPVGTWDLAAAVWETGVVVGCVALLCAESLPTRAAPWFDWHATAGTWFAVSFFSLGVLSSSGVG